MINLWCDPSDPDCNNGRPSRPVPPPSPTPSTPQGKPPPPMAAGCVSADADGPVSFKWTGGFVFPKLPDHGFVTANSSASCCAMCQTFKNCTFWTYERGSSPAAKPTCYGMAGACCYLKTAAAWAGRSPGEPSGVSGSTKTLPPLPPPPPPPPPPPAPHFIAANDPKEAFELMLKMSEYVLPKLARTEVTGANGDDLFKDVSFSFGTPVNDRIIDLAPDAEETDYEDL